MPGRGKGGGLSKKRGWTRGGGRKPAGQSKGRKSGQRRHK